MILAAVSGEVDPSNANDLGSRIREALSNDATALVVDLTDTVYIDSAGLNLLFQLNVELKARQQALRMVVEPGSPVERVLKIVGFDTAVPTHDRGRKPSRTSPEADRDALDPHGEPEQWPRRVYVIELDREAGRRRDPRLPWLYVGSSARSPEERFEQHLNGYKSARIVKKHPLRLRPDLYEDLEPLRSGGSKAAVKAEKARARELARCGFVAHCDGISYGKGEGDWVEWGEARLAPVAHHVDEAARELIDVVVRSAARRALRPAAPRRARVLGPGVHRPGRPSPGLRALPARDRGGAAAAGRGAGAASRPSRRARPGAGRRRRRRRPARSSGGSSTWTSISSSTWTVPEASEQSRTWPPRVRSAVAKWRW